MEKSEKKGENFFGGKNRETLVFVELFFTCARARFCGTFM